MRLRRNVLSLGGLVSAPAQSTQKGREEAQTGKEEFCLDLSHLAIKYHFYFVESIDILKRILFKVK